jgi:hypothetical protein
MKNFLLMKRHWKTWGFVLRVSSCTKCPLCSSFQLKVVCAYVTFNHEESFLRCVSDYRLAQPWWRYYLYPSELKLQGHRITVEKASGDLFNLSQVLSCNTFALWPLIHAAPCDILWENLDTTKRDRSLRRTTTLILTLLLLIASVGLIQSISGYRKQVRL